LIAPELVCGSIIVIPHFRGKDEAIIAECASLLNADLPLQAREVCYDPRADGKIAYPLQTVSLTVSL
jgi:hypothetical protein